MEEAPSRWPGTWMEEVHSQISVKMKTGQVEKLLVCPLLDLGGEQLSQ